MTLKQQIFCQQVAIGETATHAYVHAYGAKITTARVMASKIITRPHIEAEIQRLRKIAREAADADVVLSILEKRKWLAGAVRTNVTDLAQKNDKVKPYIKKISLRVIGSGENASEIEEIEGYDKARLIEIDTDLAGDAPPDASILALGNFLQTAIDPQGKVIPTDRM